MYKLEQFHWGANRRFPKDFARDTRLVHGLITSVEVHLAKDRYTAIWQSPLTQGLLTIIFYFAQTPVITQQAFIAATWADFWFPDPDGQPIPEMHEFTRLLLLVLESQESSPDTPFNLHCLMYEPMIMAVPRNTL
jgi:hypothetical protein